VTFTLSGDIDGDGNVRHSGEGMLVLSGNDSSYSGGTYVSRGTLEVQSAKGLGATSEGLGSVTVEMDADLLVTVEDGYTEQRMVTTLAADENDIQGDVVISGTADTERMLHMDGNGYNALSTTLNQNGTLLLNGAAINGAAVKAESKLLTGSGKVVVSDASGAGASATFDSIIDYAGDFHVEGNNASIGVLAGAFSGGGSIHVSGKNASVNITGGISILDGESLNLSSAGNALSGGRLDSASVVTSGTVSIAAGAKLYVSKQDTAVYDYDLAKLKEDGSLEVSHFALMQAESVLSTAETVLPDVVYKEVGTESVKYDGRYDFNIAVNSQAAGAVQAAEAGPVHRGRRLAGQHRGHRLRAGAGGLLRRLAGARGHPDGADGLCGGHAAGHAVRQHHEAAGVN
jgi:autotransporter-associated beta strand protein